MKKFTIILSILVGFFILFAFFIYFFESYQNIKIRNANACYNELTKEIIKVCDKKWGEPGNECRNDFFYKTPCGKAIREVYFPNKIWGNNIKNIK